MLMIVPFIFQASEFIFSLSLKLATLTTIVRLLFFSLLPTLCALSTEMLSSCSFSLNKFCKISSVCSHISFSYSINHQIITTRSVFKICQSLTKLVVIFPKLVNVFLKFLFLFTKIIIHFLKILFEYFLGCFQACFEIYCFLLNFSNLSLLS